MTMRPSSSDGIGFRLARAEDLGFVIANWLESFRCAHAAGPIPMDLYVEVYRTAIDRLLQRPAVDVLVAVSGSGEEEGRLGFLCAERHPRAPIVHYVLVVQSQRRQGLCAELLRRAEIDVTRPLVYTFRTAGGARWARQFCFAAKLDPLCARYQTAYREDR